MDPSQTNASLPMMAYVWTQLCFRRLPTVKEAIGEQICLSPDVYDRILSECTAALATTDPIDTDLREIDEEYTLWAPPSLLSLPETVSAASSTQALAEYLLSGEVREACMRGVRLTDNRMAFLNKDVHSRMFTLLENALL